MTRQMTSMYACVTIDNSYTIVTMYIRQTRDVRVNGEVVWYVGEAAARDPHTFTHPLTGQSR
jgi:hypothetical protein